ncbi:hypothetical protein BC834DRAFT_885698 [Gloeopeniophorella convolvens]|nr:hypothetical protein BC834DRAFT_885698 [Gloeopeniophorella convolvens]
MQLKPVSRESLPNKLRYSLCEIWNRAVGVAPDRDEHKVALHILACLQPVYHRSHPQAFTVASQRSQGVKTYDELIALKQSDFPPCTEVSHCRPPTSHPPPPAPSHFERLTDQPQGVTSPELARLLALEPSGSALPSNPAIPVTLITPGTSEMPVLGTASMSLPTVDLALPVEPSLQNNDSALLVPTSVQNILLPSSPVGADNPMRQTTSTNILSSPDADELSTGSGAVVTVDVEHVHVHSSSGDASQSPQGAAKASDTVPL